MKKAPWLSKNFEISENFACTVFYRRRHITYIIIAFIFSRLLFFYVGIRFDASSLNWFYQYIDPNLLRNNLFQSVYYLHSQPPLFNLFLGSILKLFPNYELLAFNFIYVVLGLILAVSIFLIMNRLGVSSKLSAILTVLFIVSPSAILYENWLFYTYPLAILLCLCALFLHKFLSSAHLRDGGLFFTLLSFVVLTRSFFHILWFVLFVLILLFYQRHNWKKVIFASCIPFLVIFLLYVKNLYIFRSFTSSTWFGMNFSKMTNFVLSEDERELLVSLVSQGKISEISLIPPFKSLKEYQAHLTRIQKTNIPVLDQEVKSNGAINFNNIAYIDISRQYLKDAFSVLIAYPDLYLKRLVKSYLIYFRPSSEYFYLDSNRQHIQPLEKFYDTVFYGRLLYYKHNPAFKKENPLKHYALMSLNTGLFLIIGFLVSVFYGLRLILNTLSRKPGDLPFGLTVLFLWINVVYITVVGNSFEVGENNRFRFMIDPFFLIILGLFLNHKFRKFKQYVA